MATFLYLYSTFIWGSCWWLGKL